MITSFPPRPRTYAGRSECRSSGESAAGGYLSPFGRASFFSTRSRTSPRGCWRRSHRGSPTERLPPARLTHTVWVASHSTSNSGSAKRNLHASKRPLPPSSVKTTAVSASGATGSGWLGDWRMVKHHILGLRWRSGVLVRDRRRLAGRAARPKKHRRRLKSHGRTSILSRFPQSCRLMHNQLTCSVNKKPVSLRLRR